MSDQEIRLQALKLAYELTFKMEKDADMPSNWNIHTNQEKKEEYFDNLKMLADFNLEYIKNYSDKRM